jgi:hypothetical protein
MRWCPWPSVAGGRRRPRPPRPALPGSPGCELSTEAVERPADDPREYLALRQQAAAREELRREYETALSWRLTKPLRGAAGLGRSLRARRRS